jgi:hypothetical protein
LSDLWQGEAAMKIWGGKLKPKKNQTLVEVFEAELLAERQAALHRLANPVTLQDALEAVYWEKLTGIPSQCAECVHVRECVRGLECGKKNE